MEFTSSSIANIWSTHIETQRTGKKFQPSHHISICNYAPLGDALKYIVSL